MGPKKERCLLLCMAYPDYSQKYGATVCMAGITEEGELRRIYPIPMETFREVGFAKRRWIEYDIREKGDYRKESYKINPDSVTVGEAESYLEVRNRLEERVTTIEELNRQQTQDEISLGFVKPIVDYFTIDEDKEREQRAKKYQEQTTLTGAKMPVEVLPHQLRYHFRCGPDCTTDHRIMCEDIEAGQLYRRMNWNYDSIDLIESKMREKFVDWMYNERDLYFMMGTHYSWKTWLIISVLYPKPRKDRSLEHWS